MDRDQEQYRYEYISKQIEREDGLINYRLVWTLQLNGFLFAALALVRSDADVLVKKALLNALPIAGFLIALVGLFGIIGAIAALYGLKKQWDNQPDMRWSRPCGDSVPFAMGALPSVFAPLVLMGIWFYLFFSFR